jgi:long-chain fatty acid transport protein
MNLNQKLVLLAGLSLASTLSSHGAATRIAYVDPFATARGNAFTATADNASAVFYNAAGLTQLEGTAVQANVYAISLGYEYDGAAGNESMDDDFQAVPSFFAGHNFEDLPIAVGFGAYAPFALSSDWGSDAFFADPLKGANPVVPYEATLAYVKYHATIAWQISETLAVAIGTSFDDTEVDIKANAIEFDGDDQTVGFSASALWKPSEKHAFGLNYQAKTEATYDGTANVLLPAIVPLDAKADLIFPESIVFGYSYRPNEKWNFEFNLDWTNWDRVNSLELDTAIPLPAYELNWESAFIWELGTTRYFENGWHVSAGYTYVENAIPDAEFLPIVPDSDRHFFALGVGRSYDHFSWQLTYQFTYAEERSVSGTINDEDPPGALTDIDGSYDLDSQAVAFSLSYRF